ncbi:3-oxoadipate CoA-transferase beta subunit [Parapusillimonas granuli]|uniref:3-oxoacid CoA-transferase subunit B n=2 Tax=Parapusillimonas granuli TaxID=380911 RepID=A0A853FVW2_9BURK|nr:3-oxoacid CoA-transferase subunit B [Parapusillimonas granuli]MBB5216173.1 3-oxoadipate CoA-transferase beta subunit [Parapusillimonas granuli]MEB2400448.1 3-oxoacid CoA-transferase subunit B [Alcaligenaceae bacterium]NYT47852.1 3-oxoacid CoA-transferase subunit B [Parapusillimonas granuli]
MSTIAAQVQPWTRDQMARRAARDIQEGWFVNLGIGIPTLIANHVPAGKEVIFHAENGVVGVGPAPDPERIEPWLINAGKQYVTLRPGGCFVHHADSFSMIRGGHLDLCVLGAYDVSARGDIANWALSRDDTAPAVGGAMDLAVGAKRLWVLMEHVNKQGQPRLVNECRYPLTAFGSVDRVYTNLAVLDVRQTHFRVIDMAPGVTQDHLISQTEAELRFD